MWKFRQLAKLYGSFEIERDTVTLPAVDCFITMKFFVLTAYGLVLCGTLALAAPAKRTLWEYATVDFSASQSAGGNSYRYGAELILPNKKAIFLEVKNASGASYKAYLLNRLGARGWELASSPGDRSDRLYIFKRPK